MSISSRKKNRFSWLIGYSLKVDFEFSPFRSFIGYSKQMIDDLESEVENDIVKWNDQNTSNPDVPNGVSFYFSELSVVSEFKPLLYSSLFISVYSLFENEFYSICEYAGKIEGSKLKPSDLDGRNIIGKNKRYLEKVLGIDMSSLSVDWEKVTKIQTIRNAFTHNNGKLKSTDPSMVVFIEKSKGLSLIQESNQICFDSEEFIVWTIDKLNRFLLTVIEEIVDQKY